MPKVDEGVYLKKNSFENILKHFNVEGSREEVASYKDKYSGGEHALVIYKEVDGEEVIAIIVGSGRTHNTINELLMGAPFLSSEDNRKFTPHEYCLLEL